MLIPLIFSLLPLGGLVRIIFFLVRPLRHKFSDFLPWEIFFKLIDFFFSQRISWKGVGIVQIKYVVFCWLPQSKSHYWVVYLSFKAFFLCPFSILSKFLPWLVRLFYVLASIFYTSALLLDHFIKYSAGVSNKMVPDTWLAYCVSAESIWTMSFT